MEPEDIICYCNVIDRQTIEDAIDDGATTIDAIMNATGASEDGRCRELNPKGRTCAIEIYKILDYKI